MVFTDKELTLKTPNTLYLSLRSILNKADVHICISADEDECRSSRPCGRCDQQSAWHASSDFLVWVSPRRQPAGETPAEIKPRFVQPYSWVHRLFFNDISWTCKCLLITVLSADPAPVQLINQFLEQASKPSVNEQNQVQPPADNRRNRTLKLLALKVAAHMKWDLEVLEKGWVRVF